MAAALARSISRAMTVAFAADDAPMTRLCFGDVHTRNVEAHVCDDARPVSLRVAHITKSLNITHTRTAAAAARARSLLRTMAVAIAADAASMVRAC